MWRGTPASAQRGSIWGLHHTRGSVNGGGEKKGKIIWDKYEKYEG